jgi:hypothetical protein
MKLMAERRSLVMVEFDPDTGILPCDKESTMRPFQFYMPVPRHPLMRILLGAVGLALLGFFTVFGLLIAAVALAGLALHRLFRRISGQTPAPTRPIDPRVIEGEFTVVEKQRLPR